MPQRPNVIIVITDDQGYGDIGSHGNPVLETPSLDQLARESLQLDNHHGDPLCSPSRAALLTGQYAARNGVWHVIHGRHLLDPAAFTAGDIFSQNGYRTGMFGKWHLGDNYPFAPQHRGFDRVVSHGGGGIGELPDYWGNNYIDDTYFCDGDPKQFSGYCTDVFFTEALDFIESESAQPFFVYLATNAMHAPHIVPEAYALPYRAAGVEDERANFYGMIANFDENMGRLTRRLEELGIADDTILIFTSDHGTAAGYDPAAGAGFNAGMRGKKGSLYEGGHRVSCFLRRKNHLPAGTVVKSLSAHIDILPTLAELCDLDMPHGHEFDGLSVFSLLDGKPEARAVITHLQPDTPQKWNQCAVMRDSWRLIDGVELYNLSTDPGQRNDVALAHPRLVASMRADYEAWWASVQAAFAKFVYIPVGGSEANPVLLSARDWHPTRGRVPWRQSWIDDPAYDAEGFWMIDVASAGRFQFELGIYPKEAQKRGGITCARIQINELVLETETAPDGRFARFTLDLPAGRARLETWLESGDGRVRGAYYVYVERLENGDQHGA